MILKKISNARVSLILINYVLNLARSSHDQGNCYPLTVVTNGFFKLQCRRTGPYDKGHRKKTGVPYLNFHPQSNSQNK